METAAALALRRLRAARTPDRRRKAPDASQASQPDAAGYVVHRSRKAALREAKAAKAASRDNTDPHPPAPPSQPPNKQTTQRRHVKASSSTPAASPAGASQGQRAQPTELSRRINRLRDHVRQNADVQSIVDAFARAQRSFRSPTHEQDPAVRKLFLRQFDSQLEGDRAALARVLHEWFGGDHPISNEEFKNRLTRIVIAVPAEHARSTKTSWRQALLKDVADSTPPPANQSNKEVLGQLGSAVTRAPTGVEVEQLLQLTRGTRKTVGLPPFVQDIASVPTAAFLATMVTSAASGELAAILGGMVKIPDDASHADILRMLTDGATGPSKLHVDRFKAAILAARYDSRVNAVIFSTSTRAVADEYAGSMIPIQGRMVQLKRTTSLQEDPAAAFGGATVDLRLYEMQVWNLNGRLDAVNVWHVFHGMLRLQVMYLAQAPAGTDGVQDRTLWNVAVASHGCPAVLRQKTRIQWGEETLWIHHKAIHAHPPCVKCGSSGHTARGCTPTNAAAPGSCVTVHGLPMDINEDMADAGTIASDELASWMTQLDKKMRARSRLLAGRRDDGNDKESSSMATTNLEKLEAADLQKWLVDRVCASDWLLLGRQTRRKTPQLKTELMATGTAHLFDMLAMRMRSTEWRATPEFLVSRDEFRARVARVERETAIIPYIARLRATTESEWWVERSHKYRLQAPGEQPSPTVYSDSLRFFRRIMSRPVATDEEEPTSDGEDDDEEMPLATASKATPPPTDPTFDGLLRAEWAIIRAREETERAVNGVAATVLAELIDSVLLEEATASHAAMTAQPAQHPAGDSEVSQQQAANVEKPATDQAEVHELQHDAGAAAAPPPSSAAALANHRMIASTPQFSSSLRLAVKETAAQSLGEAVSHATEDEINGVVYDDDYYGSSEENASVCSVGNASHAHSMEDSSNPDPASGDERGAESSDGELPEAMDDQDIDEPPAGGEDPPPAEDTATVPGVNPPARLDVLRRARIVHHRVSKRMMTAPSASSQRALAEYAMELATATMGTADSRGRHNSGKTAQLGMHRFLSKAAGPPKADVHRTDAAPGSATATSDEVEYAGSVAAPPLPADHPQSWKAAKAKTGLVERDPPGLGSCLEYSLFGVLWGSWDRVTPITPTAIAKREAEYTRSGLFGFLHQNYDEYVETQLIDEPSMCLRLTGAAEVTDTTRAELLDEIKRAAGQPVDRMIAERYWAGPEAVKMAVLWMRQPILVIDRDVSQRFDAQLYYLQGCRSRVVGQTETVRVKTLSFAQVEAWLTDYKEACVVPLVLSLDHARRHFTALRVEEERYTKYALRPKSRKEMFARLRKLLRSKLMYVPPVTRPRPLLLTKFATATHGADDDGDEDYAPSTASSAPSSTDSFVPQRGHGMREMIRLATLSADSEEPAPPQEECKTDTEDPAQTEHLRLTELPASLSQELVVYDAQTQAAPTQTQTQERDLASPTFTLSNEPMNQVDQTQTQLNADDDDMDSFAFAQSDLAAPATASSTASTPVGPDDGQLPYIRASYVTPLSPLAEAEYMELMARVRTGHDGISAQEMEKAALDKAVSCLQRQYVAWRKRAGERDSGLRKLLHDVSTVEGACVVLTNDPERLLDLLGSLPYVPVLATHLDTKLFKRLGKTLLTLGRMRMLDRLSMSATISAQAQEFCGAWARSFAGLSSAEARWAHARSPERWQRLQALVPAHLLPAQSLPDVEDQDWGVLLAHLMVSPSPVRDQLRSWSLLDACDALVTWTAHDRRVHHTVLAARAFQTGAWTAPSEFLDGLVELSQQQLPTASMQAGGGSLRY